MDNDRLDMAFQQSRAFDKPLGNQLSNVPYYIQNLANKMDRIEYKLDLLLAKTNKD